LAFDVLGRKMASVAHVVLDHVSKVFYGPTGLNIAAVRDFSVSVEDGEFLVLVGPSGCGKTTTLRLIAGLEKPDSGTISLDGKMANDVPPKDRDVAMVFQNHALYPHMPVYENLAFGLKLRKFSKAEIQRRVSGTAQLLGISDCLARKPDEISGGQRQRVALGRALVREPRVLLLDEPLSNLDAPMRLTMRAEISKLHKKLNFTMVYVTHDQMEAMTLGTRIGVMKEGILQQVADPMTLYQQPANMFVAGFIGSPPMNFFTGTISQTTQGLFFRESSTDGETEINGFDIAMNNSLASSVSKFIGKRIVLGIRPEHIRQKEEPRHSTEAAIVRAEAEAIMPVGPEIYLQVSSAFHSFSARIPAPAKINLNEKLDFVFDLRFAQLFDPESQNRIG